MLKSRLGSIQLRDTVSKLVQQALYSLLTIPVSLLAYATVLIIPVPQGIGLDALYGFTTVAMVIALLCYPAYRCSGWTGILVSLTSILILFALPLLGLWNSGISDDGTVIGGLLPWSDASNYYLDAKRVLEGGTFSGVSSWRPLFAGILVPLLGLTQQNLQVTLAILVAINAIACFLLAREIQHTHGTLAGLGVLTVLFLFYRRYAGTLMTENLGLALGAVGLALLWRGAWQKQINNCCFGILLLTLALNARAGAFFILPAILLWGAWSFRGTARFSSHFLIGGVSAILLGFIFNSILLKLIGSPHTRAFSNFSYVLYGLIVGGNWTQVMKDHPELYNYVEPELTQEIYALAFEALRAAPLRIVIGALRAWKQFLFEDYVFSFLRNLKINFYFQLLSLIALLNCYRQRKNSNASLILSVTWGILLSVPFVPPWDADTMRAYAATLPIIALLPTLGLVVIANKMQWQQLVEVKSQEKSSQLLFLFCLIFTGFIFIAPIATKIFSHPSQFTKISCQEGDVAVYLRFSSGSSIHLVKDDSRKQSHVPNIRISDFRNGLENLAEAEVVKELRSLTSSTTLMNSLNVTNKSDVWLILKSSLIPKDRGIFGVCGKWSDRSDYGFFYADSVQAVSASGNETEVNIGQHHRSRIQSVL